MTSVLLALLLQLSIAQTPATAYVRVTHYTLCCRTANGESVYPGSTACSFNFPFGTQFSFDDGTQVTCNDRGRLYFNPQTEDGWLDLYSTRADLDGHATVLVVAPADQ